MSNVVGRQLPATNVFTLRYERKATVAITATAGDVFAAIEPRRPAWSDMKKHYPASEMGIKTLYDKIGGAFAGQH